MTLKIAIKPIYIDDSIMVLDKPAGIPVLPDGWDKDAPFLIKLVEAEYAKVWVVHRLDKVTSGVMVIARDADAHRVLNLQFEKHEVKKIYHAICNGEPDWDVLTARHHLRVNVGHSHRTVVDHARGVSTETTFQVLERLGEYCLLEATPRTGRTHQIRVHAYALGYPLLGDTLYSAPETDLIIRPALHAKSLQFIHPVTGEWMSFASPYPDDFISALEKLRAGQ
jgi:RluA family pseudouridine synthase